MYQPAKKNKLPFIAGQSKSAETIREYSWENNTLGSPEAWTAALRTTINLILLADSPMYVAWGNEQIGFCNDAFSKISGNSPGDIIGLPAKKIFTQEWDQYRGFFQDVSFGSHGFTDRLFIGNAHWKCSFSPVFNEKNEPAGILLVPGTREKAEFGEQMESHFYNLIMQSPVPVTIFRGDDFVIEMANQAMFKGIWRKSPEEVLGKKLLDVFPELKSQKYPELLKQVIDSGLPYSENESRAVVEGNDGSKVFYLDYEYAPLKENDGHSSGILVTVNDVTEKMNSKIKVLESETRLKIAIESAEIGTFDWDIIHSDFQYSERLALMFGYKNSKNLDHSSFRELIHPDDVGIRLQAHKESFETGKLFYEARFVKPDQSICWLRLNGKVFFDENGFPQRMYGTALDITHHKTKTNALEIEVERKKAELDTKIEELTRSEERYQRMTEEVQDYAILLLDPDGTILNWNKGAEKIKGYHEKEILGKNFNVFYLPEDKKNHVPEKLIRQAAEFGRASQEGWRMRKDQSAFWASVVITALHNSKNEIVGFSKVTRDLTERKIAEDKLKQYNTELEFQNKELEQFVYIASHDLQEPLRKIQTFSGMLQDNLDNPESLNFYVEKIKTSAQRMTDLIKSVLNYSRLSKAVIEFEDVDLNELLENVKIDFELLISEKNAKIIHSALPVVKGIPLQLTQLFSNLIGNSLKFTQKEPEIKISSQIVLDKEIVKFPKLQTGSKYVQLTFTDNGIGFDKQYAKQIFDMFQRLHDKQSYSGTGIGLALCKRIVENHHGFISATSEKGEGATFRIYFPL